MAVDISALMGSTQRAAQQRLGGSIAKASAPNGAPLVQAPDVSGLALQSLRDSESSKTITAVSTSDILASMNRSMQELEVKVFGAANSLQGVKQTAEQGKPK